MSQTIDYRLPGTLALQAGAGLIAALEGETLSSRLRAMTPPALSWGMTMRKVTDQARLEDLRERVIRQLEDGILPFWRDRARDPEHGGFLTNFDERGVALATPEKYLNTQCRLTWWFAHLERTRPGLTGNAELAQRGVDFLLRHFWDKDQGGFTWKVHRDGAPLDQGKIVYGLSFAIYALAEYALACGDSRGLDYAGRTFDLLQKHCADTRHGGYFEYFQPDWTLEEPGFGGGDRKTLDTHLHLMESFTVLYEASRSPLHRRKLIEVIDLLCAHMIDPRTGCGLNHFDPAWQSIPAIAIKRTWNAERMGDQPPAPTDTTSYGHNVETAWLLERALAVAGLDARPYHPVMKRLLDHAVAHGVDGDYGGIYRDGTRDGGPLILEKEFWQHAESLVGFLMGYERFGDARYLDAFESVWRFVEQHFIIAGVGEWRTLLDRQGRPIDANIGNPWKVSYHTGRAMSECAQRLARMVGNSPRAPTDG